MPLASHRRSLDPGALVFREGEPGTCAYVIESGSVEVSALRGSAAVVLARLTAGDLFGEMALIENRPRSATVRAVGETTLIEIPRDLVMRKMQSTDPLIRLVLRVILRRLRKTSRLLDPNALAARGFDPEATLDDTGLRKARAEALRDLQREQRLEDAIVRGEFEAFFQPMVSLKTGCTAGFEAVLRWRSPEAGVLAPDAFVGLAEDSGLMGLLTRIILERACGALPVLQKAVGAASTIAPPAHVSFNLSARELADPAIVEDVLSAARLAQIDPHHLQVEVTEGAIMVDPVRAEWVLRSLKSNGLSVGVDDFGTGYSSLSYLQRYPVDVLKLDGSFVTALPARGETRKIVRAILRMARDLDLVTVAEGVEREDELALVQEYGCDLAQGFLLAPPLPLEDAALVGSQRFAVSPSAA
jgi:EAL domain-containing protein (putative c-di-GMP-specific phosphodiesterase class I)